MGWIVFVIIVLVLGPGSLALGKSVSAKTPGARGFRMPRKVVMFLTAFLILSATGVNSLQVVPSGEVGVVYRFGEIVGQRGEGLNIIAPWENLTKANIRTQKATFERVSAASAETQDVFLDISINYSLSANAVQTLFREVGVNWFSVLVPPRVTNYAKAETAKYSTVDIISNREVIRRAVTEKLAADLEPYSITISDLLIENIDFQPAFKSAIEEKQVATENAKREKEKVAQELAKADQARARAKGEADAEILRAEGVAEANRLISQSLTPAVLQYQAIDRLADKIQIALIPAGEGLILDPATLLKPIEVNK